MAMALPGLSILTRGRHENSNRSGAEPVTGLARLSGEHPDMAFWKLGELFGFILGLP